MLKKLVLRVTTIPSENRLHVDIWQLSDDKEYLQSAKDDRFSFEHIGLESFWDDNNNKFYQPNLEFITRYSLSLMQFEVKRIAATMAAIDKKVDKLRNTLGYCSSVSEIVCRLGAAINAIGYIFNNETQRDNKTYKIYGASSIKQKIDDFEKETANKINGLPVAENQN